MNYYEEIRADMLTRINNNSFYNEKYERGLIAYGALLDIMNFVDKETIATLSALYVKMTDLDEYDYYDILDETIDTAIDKLDDSLHCYDMDDYFVEYSKEYQEREVL